VTTNDDGTVTITINRLDDPEGLERDLAAHGISAQIDFAPPGKACEITASIYDPENPPVVHSRVAGAAETMTLRPADAEGKTLVIQGNRVAHEEAGPREDYAFFYRFADGPVAPCVLVDTP
jgi:hypothetical protein